MKYICTRFFNGITLCQKYLLVQEQTIENCLFEAKYFLSQNGDLGEKKLIFSVCLHTYVSKYVANFLQNRTSSPECYQGRRNIKKWWG